MANEKRLIYLEDAIALLEKDIAENKDALKTAYHGDKDVIRAEMNGVRVAIHILKHHASHCGTVDAVEVVHGRWEDFCRGKMCCCSVCKAEFDNTCNEIHGEWYYCPNCGADMRGDGNG